MSYLFPGIHAFQWTGPATEPESYVSVCDGGDVTIYNTYTLDDNEGITKIEWYFKPNAATTQIQMAIYIFGTYIPMQAYQNRLTPTPSGVLFHIHGNRSLKASCFFLITLLISKRKKHQETDLAYIKTKQPFMI